MALKRRALTSAGTPTPIGKVAWEDEGDTPTQRCTIMEVYGDSSTGRTTLAVTAPGPIAYLHSSEKKTGIVHRAVANGTVIRSLDFGQVIKRGSDQTIATQARETLARFLEAYDDAWTWAKSIVIDDHPSLWILHQLAEWGTQTPSNKSGSFAWGPVTAKWQSLIDEARHQDSTNLILIGATKDEYKGPPGKGSRTGNTIRTGQRDVFRSSDVVLRTGYDRGSDRYTATVEKPWYGGHAMGAEFDNELATFEFVITEITGIDYDEWR